MFIGKAAQLSGTTVKSIRHYEEIGLLPPARRQGKYRLYDQDSVERLTFIKCAQQLGFKLKELQAVLQGQLGQALPWHLAHQVIVDKKQELTDRIAALTRQYVQLTEFEASLKQAQSDCPLERV
ncbi:MerR family transcriptional regulator [Pseudomonas fluorescens HK44]|uniref:MerR family transcriptional regulator n=1 Tax=Pseudomonas fluorescens HK44 TaxID=1042209 RepID=A0A010RF40_PSEFL|nr:MerR family transcriptional regulator [Pseudomonas fluorescens]EXF91416.1 MerR family transcriptional regulator [Pseudomonas fluorescens HK44]